MSPYEPILEFWFAETDPYPHRNAALGRASTSEEIEFLGQSGSSF